MQITPKPEASGGPGLNRFVDQVSEAVPEAGGSAVTIIATSRTITGAFRNAAIAAVVMNRGHPVRDPAAGRWMWGWCWRRCCCPHC